MATGVTFLLALTLFSVHALYNFPTKDSLSGIEQRTLNQLRQINDEKLKKSITMAERSVNSSVNVETNILRSVRVNENTISYGQWLQGFPILEARKNNYVAAVMLKSSLYVLNKECREKRLSDVDCAKFISTLKVPDSYLRDQCEEAVKDNAEKGLRSYRRLLPANYKDGLQAIRTSATPRKSLPSSRQLSEKFYNAGIKAMQADSNHQFQFELSQQPNLILPQWTYFIEHDLTKTVIGTMINGEPIECCSDVNLPVSPRHLHPACYPLQVTDQDSFYGQLGVTCLNYVRSALAVESDCKLGPAQQLNEASGIFDLSQLYGYNENITNSLRTHVSGELKKSRGKRTSSLPSTDASDQFCMHAEKKRACYMAGDPRINLNPYTTVIYAIFHKSHNRIAATLSALNPHWDDAMLFPVARAINVGLYQQVIFQEWVANVLGESVTRSLEAEKYDDHLDNRVSNEFATAAIRFSNSMIPGDLFAFEDQMHGHYGNLLDPTSRGETLDAASKLFSLQDVFFKPKSLLKRKFAKSIVKASMVEKAMRLDTSYVDDLSSQLFRAKIRNGKDFGTDSLALDIQRGRDHGLSPYVEYVKACQKKDIQNWGDLEGIVYAHDLTTMKEMYHTVADIDLIVGLLAEIPSNQSLVGATMSCILAEQMSNAKRADQTFYTGNFDGRVLETVAGYTGAKLLCDTLDLEMVAKNIFKIPSVKNHMIMCNDPSLTGLNLNAWKDT